MTWNRGSLQKGIQWDEETIAGINSLDCCSSSNKSESFRPYTRSSQSLTTFLISFVEHDKDRGTRQKIDEPPTPYSYYPYEGMFKHLPRNPI
jgi:hypothetical protein